MLSQWICQGRLIFGESPPNETSTLSIEFVRLADMCGVTGMETLMAERIKGIIIAQPAGSDIFGEEYFNTRLPHKQAYCFGSIVT